MSALASPEPPLPAALFEEPLSGTSAVRADLIVAASDLLLDVSDPPVTVARLHALPCGEYRALIADGVLSGAEAARVIALGLSAGLRDVSCGYRTSQRLLLDSEDLAARLFARVRGFLPAELTLALDNSHPSCLGLTGRTGADGVYDLVGLNTRFRLCHYAPGGRFLPHFDTQFCVDAETASFFTLMIYLNAAEGAHAAFAGGETVFLSPPTGEDGCAQTPARLAAVVPAAGRAVLFPHHLYHEGAEVLGGEKWILRTDVMFTRRPGTRAVREPRLERALLAQQRAVAAEERGDTAEAMRQWQLAGKLDPESKYRTEHASEVSLTRHV